MPIEINISSITGESPYNVYLCDNPVTFCIFIDTIISTPYQFEVPSIMRNDNNFNLKVVDNNNSVVFLPLEP
jgi:hypothetical protein